MVETKQNGGCRRLEGAGVGSFHLMGTQVQLCKTEKVPEMDGDDSCVTVRMPNATVNLKIVKMTNSMSYNFTTFLKRKCNNKERLVITIKILEMYVLGITHQGKDLLSAGNCCFQL